MDVIKDHGSAEEVAEVEPTGGLFRKEGAADRARGVAPQCARQTSAEPGRPTGIETGSFSSK
jgi:hypothetical protein